jgi:hypothetical protein
LSPPRLAGQIRRFIATVAYYRDGNDRRGCGMDGGIFINYRGEDSHSYGALLYVELSRRFGADLVFLDSESIPAGADFVDELLGRVRRCRVMLAVIGARWVVAAGRGDTRRIDDPEDWTRRELALAFGAGVLVIPVLTDGAELPAETELPADIAALSRCQYRQLRHREATADLDRICDDLVVADVGLAAARRRRFEAPYPQSTGRSAWSRFRGRREPPVRAAQLPGTESEVGVAGHHHIADRRAWRVGREVGVSGAGTPNRADGVGWARCRVGRARRVLPGRV